MRDTGRDRTNNQQERNMATKKITPAQDDKMDKKAGIKEGSKKDMKLDAKRGIKEDAKPFPPKKK